MRVSLSVDVVFFRGSINVARNKGKKYRRANNLASLEPARHRAPLTLLPGCPAAAYFVTDTVIDLLCIHRSDYKIFIRTYDAVRIRRMGA